MNPKKLLFVCTGNICRSPLAHALFQKEVDECGLSGQFELESAGTHGYHIGEDADPRMRATAQRRGAPFSHGARKISLRDIEYYDYIFVMDHGHLREVGNMAAQSNLAPDELKEKVRMYREFDPQASSQDDVPDPYYGGQNGFDHVFDIVERTSKELLRVFQDGRL